MLTYLLKTLHPPQNELLFVRNYYENIHDTIGGKWYTNNRILGLNRTTSALFEGYVNKPKTTKRKYLRRTLLISHFDPLSNELSNFVPNCIPRRNSKD